MSDTLNRITNLIKRAFVSLVGKDKGNYPTTQVSYLDKTATVELLYPYGFCSTPPKDSLVLMFNVQGQEENRAGIANLPSKRFKELKSGEVAVGNYLTKAVIKFLENGDVELTVPQGNLNVNVSENISMNAQNISMTGISFTGTFQSVNWNQ